MIPKRRGHPEADVIVLVVVPHVIFFQPEPNAGDGRQYYLSIVACKRGKPPDWTVKKFTCWPIYPANAERGDEVRSGKRLVATAVQPLR
jgi:hypothetical protein